MGTGSGSAGAVGCRPGVPTGRIDRIRGASRSVVSRIAAGNKVALGEDTGVGMTDRLSRVVLSGPRGCGQKKGGRVSSGRIKELRVDEVGYGTGWGILNRRAVMVHIAQEVSRGAKAGWRTTKGGEKSGRPGEAIGDFVEGSAGETARRTGERTDVPRAAGGG